MAINEIAQRLDVSKSSVSLWVRAIELTDEQRQALLERNPAYNRQHSGSIEMAARRRAERARSQEDGRLRVRRRDEGFVAGCMLYWAEGSKDRNRVEFANADPEMARFFVEFLKIQFGLSGDEIRIRCNLYADHLERQCEVEDHWLNTLGLSRASLRKSTVNVYSKYSQRKRVGNLPFGTSRVIVSRTWVVQTIYGGIQEIGGFTRDSWLE
jgi:hypothetical protein